LIDGFRSWAIWLARLAGARLFPRRRPTTLPAPTATNAPPEPPLVRELPPIVPTALELGLAAIRRTDAGFDPSRFVGYAGMLFRRAQHARMSGDVSLLRDHVTPKLLGALQSQRSAQMASHIAEVDIGAVVTEARQDAGWDYVTAHIAGSMIDYGTDERTGTVVRGSRTAPRRVAELWTFTRPAGLNFWTLAEIRGA
jgi:predicted lipid-binding transport protein (Tim44 family)